MAKSAASSATEAKRCGLVRPGSPRERGLTQLGVEIAHGDLRDRASLVAACAGATSIVSTANSVMYRRPGDSLRSVDRDGHLTLIAIAAAARGDVIEMKPLLESMATPIRLTSVREFAERELARVRTA